MKKVFLFFAFIFLGVAGIQAVDNNHVDGFLKPKVCLESNIRCILKRQGDTIYWCLKSAHQRTLDARRTTTPLKKTRRQIMGHCAQIVPVREEIPQKETNP